MSEKYTIEICRTADSGDEEKLREHYAHTPEDAEVFVESLRDAYAQRDSVVWESEVVDASGKLTGLGLEEDVYYTIRVTPPLVVAR